MHSRIIKSDWLEKPLVGLIKMLFIDWIDTVTKEYFMNITLVEKKISYDIEKNIGGLCMSICPTACTKDFYHVI